MGWPSSTNVRHGLTGHPPCNYDGTNVPGGSSHNMQTSAGEKTVRTVCNIGCGMGCGLLAHVRDGVLTKLEPADFPDPSFRHVCARGLSTIKLPYHPDRLRHPLKRKGARGEGKWQQVSWDEALDAIAYRLKDTAEKYGPRSLVWATGGSGMLDMVYARLAGCLDANSVSLIGFGDSAGPCGDRANFGTLWGEKYLTDFEHPGMVVLWGSNAAETQPYGIRKFLNARDAGAHTVVIDPRYTATAALADEYIPIRPGTDTALALGLMHVILKEGLHDPEFILKHTTGPCLVDQATGRLCREPHISPAAQGTKPVVWDTRSGRPRAIDAPDTAPQLTGIFSVGGMACRPVFQLISDLVAEYTPDRVAAITGVPVETIHRLALDYGRRKPVASYRGMGMQRTFHGDLTFRSISTLNAITGNIVPEGRKDFVLNMRGFIRVAGRPNFLPVLQLYQAMAGGAPHPAKALWIAKHNMLNQLPNAGYIRNQLFPKLDFIVVADIFMNASARYADIVLPACTFLEQGNLILPPGGSPGVHSYLQLQQKVIEPIEDCRPELEIVRGVAERLGFGQYFQEDEDGFIELLIGWDHPSMAGVTLEKLKQGPVEISPDYKVPGFSTPSGRMELYTEKLLELGEEMPCYKPPIETAKAKDDRYPLAFLNTHSRYRTHSVFANVRPINDFEPEPYLEMSTHDARARGVADGDKVRVFNDRGTVLLKARVHDRIMPGVVNVTQGWWPDQFERGSYQDLTHEKINPAQQAVYEPNAALYDVGVEVEKVNNKQ